jgi:hypothetical protein
MHAQARLTLRAGEEAAGSRADDGGRAGDSGVSGSGL